MGVFRAYVGFVQRRLYLALFVVSYLYSLIGWGFRSLILPLYGQGVLALTVTQIGLLSSITSVLLFLIQFFLSGRLERVMGRRRRLTLGLVLCGGALYGYSTTAHLYGVAAFSAVLGLGLGIVSPSLEALWIDITDPAERGRVYGLRTAFFDVGQISWSLILTALATMNPIAPLYLAGATALITGLLLFVVLRTRRVQ